MAQFPGARRGPKFDHIRVGAELNSYSKEDKNQLTPTEQLSAPLEARLNTGYAFNFKNGATLALSLNFDLDNWRMVPAFEGGSGQFRTEL